MILTIFNANQMMVTNQKAHTKIQHVFSEHPLRAAAHELNPRGK